MIRRRPMTSNFLFVKNITLQRNRYILRFVSPLRSRSLSLKGRVVVHVEPPNSSEHEFTVYTVCVISALSNDIEAVKVYRTVVQQYL